MQRRFQVSFYETNFYDVIVDIDDDDPGLDSIERKAQDAAMEILAKDPDRYYAHTETSNPPDTTEMEEPEHSQLVIPDQKGN